MYGTYIPNQKSDSFRIQNNKNLKQITHFKDIKNNYFS